MCYIACVTNVFQMVLCNLIFQYINFKSFKVIYNRIYYQIQVIIKYDLYINFSKLLRRLSYHLIQLTIFQYFQNL